MDTHHDSQSVTIDTTIAAGSEYVLNLKPYGDADDIAQITKQAINYSTSEIVNSTTGFNPVYHFSASAADSKSDTVEQIVLSITEPAGHPHQDSTFVTINFTIQ